MINMFFRTIVALGAVDYRDPEQLIPMDFFTSHPSYNSNTFDYDYAVITMEYEATLSDNVS